MNNRVFMRKVKEALKAARGDNNNRLFMRVARTPSLDGPMVDRITTTPAAVLVQLDKEVQETNGEVFDATMAVAIILESGNDDTGERACEKMDEYSDKVYDLLMNNRDLGNIMCLYESSDMAYGDQGSPERVIRSFVFSYSFDRGEEEEVP